MVLSYNIARKPVQMFLIKGANDIFLLFTLTLYSINIVPVNIILNWKQFDVVFSVSCSPSIPNYWWVTNSIQHYQFIKEAEICSIQPWSNIYMLVNSIFQIRVNRSVLNKKKDSFAVWIGRLHEALCCKWIHFNVNDELNIRGMLF